jgi:hypothetical protein
VSSSLSRESILATVSGPQQRSALRFVAYLLVSGVVLYAAAAAGARSSALPVQVRLGSTGRPIPGTFLGLSFEVSELSSYIQEGPAFDRAISLLRPRSGGPMVVRLGGKSADDAYWDAPTLGTPSWVFEIGNNWLAQLSSLAKRDRLEVTLDLNLAVHSPAMEASFAKSASDALGPRLLALAIGNEPDLFRFQPGLDVEKVPATIAGTLPLWTQAYSPTEYRSDYMAYARALTQAVPGLALEGPETTSPASAWLDAVAGLRQLRPRFLTVHRYPLSTCWARNSPFYPRISSLLAEWASAGLADGLRGAIKLARRHGESLWVSEMNSVSCGRTPGVERSFGTALWAPDALFELVRAGVDGVNWHVRPLTFNAPFQLRPKAIEPMPELYGLAVFAQMLGPDARLAAVHVSSPSVVHLKAWAVISRRTTSVLLINKGWFTARVTLRAGVDRDVARIQRLLAPSVRSDSGVTFGGRWIAGDGRWHGRELIELARRRAGAYDVVVPAYSAALVRIGSAR